MSTKSKLELPEFLRSIDDLAQSLPEDKRSKLYGVALKFYTTGVEFMHGIMRSMSAEGIQACRNGNKQILSYLEKKAGKDKVYVSQFIYHL